MSSSQAAPTTARTPSLRKQRSLRDIMAERKAKWSPPPPLPQTIRTSRPANDHTPLPDLVSRVPPGPRLREKRSQPNLREKPRSDRSAHVASPAFNLEQLEASRKTTSTSGSGSGQGSSARTASSSQWDHHSYSHSNSTWTSDLTTSSVTSATNSNPSRSSVHGSKRVGSIEHLRYGIRVPILPVLEDPALPDWCTTAFNRIGQAVSHTAWNDRIDRPSMVPAFRYAVPFSPYSADYCQGGSDHDGVPTHLILPMGVSKFRTDKAGWLEDVLRYPEGPMYRSEDDKRPDLFSRAHRIAARSNGTTMIATFYRDCKPDSENHVFVSPGMAIDLKPLGVAAMQFQDRFDHLLKPLRRWLVESDSMKRDPTARTLARMVVDPASLHTEWQEALVRQDPTGLEAEFVNGQSVPIPDFDFDDHVQSSERNIRGQAIGEPELQMILSKLARVTSASLGQPLEAKKRPDRWPVVWHMNDPASVKLYEGEEASTEDDRDAGHDMRYVTGVNGAIGVTFVVELNPRTGRISSTVHPSWQFSPLHRNRLMEMNELVYEAVRPSLLLAEMTKRGIRAQGWTLPMRDQRERGWEEDTSPPMNNLMFTRRALGQTLPEASLDRLDRLVIGYSDRRDIQRHQEEAIRYMERARAALRYPTTTPNRPIRSRKPRAESPSSPTSSSASASPLMSPPPLGHQHRTPLGKVYNFQEVLRRS